MRLRAAYRRGAALRSPAEAGSTRSRISGIDDPPDLCLHGFPGHQFHTVRREFGEAPCNLVLPRGLDIWVECVLETFSQEPSQDGSVVVIER
jgi:hypothetical protein